MNRKYRFTILFALVTCLICYEYFDIPQHNRRILSETRELLVIWNYECLLSSNILFILLAVQYFVYSLFK